MRKYPCVCYQSFAGALNLQPAACDFRSFRLCSRQRCAHCSPPIWYGQAALCGYDWGQFNLANLLLHGLGVARDRKRALAWYRLAAQQGHAKAMNLVGRFHDEGWELPSNPQLAFDWYRKSAEAGDFRGQYNYATCLLRHGQLEVACDWLTRAVSHGSVDFLTAMASALSGAPDPRLREIARNARARCETAA
jgi:hypothetical protein